MTRPASRSRRVVRRASALLLPALCAALVGCVTTPLAERDWLSLRTPHHEVLSALSESETRRLAAELERFRAAAGFLWGRELPAAPVRTRVYAFDDRGIGRPYARRSERNYLLPRQRGDVIVLRTGGGWEDEVLTQLKLEYARRLLWNASGEPQPPWFQEGIAQLVSTVQSRGDGADLGAPRPGHVQALREAVWIPFERMLAASDLVGWTAPDRALFRAESWAIGHYLALREARKGDTGSVFARFRALVEGSGPLEAARQAFGDETKLEREVRRHVRASELESLTLRIRPSQPEGVGRALSRHEILEALGELALAMGEPERAARLLERALERGASSPRAIAALGSAREALGDADAADARYRSALAAAPDDAIVRVGRAQLLRSRAAASDAPRRRAALAARAREHFQRAAELAPRLPEAHAGLAATHLLEGEPAAGLAAARRAGTLLPGDVGIRLLEGRLALAAGEHAAARREAARAVTLARTRAELEAARSLLEQADARSDARDAADR